MIPSIKRRNIGPDLNQKMAALPDTLPAVIRQILASRGVASENDMNLEMGNLLSYTDLKDIALGADIIEQAVISGQSVLVVGDFDADGATATALTCLALRAFGLEQVDYLVPDRFTLGYGLSAALADIAITKKPDVVITVDNGISSVEGIAILQAAGVRVVVTDHHLPGATLPNADAIINPNQAGCDFPSKAACGCAVAFYLMAAVRAKLLAQGWFAARSVPNLAEYLDLVALATVADVVPFDRNNRILVHQGLLRIRAGQARPGINALLAVAGKAAPHLVGSDLGFAIGPRLNAAGRMEDMSLGIACLMAESEEEAQILAKQLDNLNKERRFVEQSMQEQAKTLLDNFTDPATLPWGLCLFDADWHEGVIGILASRIKDRTHRPVIAFAASGDTEIKGSARSINGFHLRDALDLIATRHPGMLNRFGGHAMAAGLTIDRGDLIAFQSAFDQVVREQLTADDLQAVMWSDGQLDGSELSLDMADQLQRIGPFGHHFPAPTFDGTFDIVDQRIVGQNHLKLVLSPIGTNQHIDAIVFNIDPAEWPTPHPQVCLRYQLDINRFRGNTSLQLMGDCLTAVATA